MHGFTWYDSHDRSNRRRNLTLVLTSPAGSRGRLYRCERETPGDVWPPQELVGTGYSITSARKIARREGLVAEEVV